MARPLLSFVAILKDEASNIRKTLESVRPYVDRWTVLDTGSTDGTQAIVREVMGRLPGVLCEEPFVDFATSRNRVLELDSEHSVLELDSEHSVLELDSEHSEQVAEFTLMLSGDEVLERGGELREFLETCRVSVEGAYCVQMVAGSGSWLYPRVFRTAGGWKYIGRVHELPVGPSGETVAQVSPGRIVHSITDASRRGKRIREFDLPILTKIVNDDSLSLPERARAMFFLADSHTALAAECDEGESGGPWLTHQMTAQSLYWRCGQLMEASDSPAHDRDKAMFAYFFYFHIAEKIGYPTMFTAAEMTQRLEAIAQADPRQPEVHFLLAKCSAYVDPRQGIYHAEEAQRVAREAREAAGKPDARYLPTDSRIEWMSMRIAADCARHMGHEDRARAFAEQGIAAGGPKESFLEFLP